MDVQLVMFKEDGERREFDLKRTVSIIGRAGDCDFQIPLAIISRRHCQITRKGERVLVKDLGSSNGTYVNNKRVLQTEVHAGDTLTVGPVVFTILIDGHPTEVKPVPTILTPVADATADSVMEEHSDAPAAPQSSVKPAPTSAKTTPEASSEGSSIDFAALDQVGIADAPETHDVDDSNVPSPLAELEELAKQHKK